VTYDDHDDTVRVDGNGSIRFAKRNIYVTTALSRMLLGLSELTDGRWLVSFMDLDLGTIEPNRRLMPLSA
jgi:hypothetical protein